jgi:Ala-tRNA(Pro) deacylase
MRIADYLIERRVAFEPLAHPPAFTAQQRAKYLRVPGGQVAKAVLVRHSTGFLLAILPATHRIDFAILNTDLGGSCRLASERELVELFPDCEWGVVPPFGSLYGLRTVLETGIATETLMVFEGQTSVDAVRIRCKDFERLEKPLRLSFARVHVPASQPRD